MKDPLPKPEPTPGTLRAKIIVDVHDPTEVAAAEAWLAAWRRRLTFIDDGSGCGCCVDIYEVEGPLEALDAIPESVLCDGDGTGWSTYERD